MNTTPSTRRRRRVATGSLALAASGVLLLTGCGPSSDSSAPAGGTASQSAQPGPAGGQGANGGNFLTGLIADVSGNTIQVQGSDAQTAVTYTSKTAITEQAKASASAIKVGACVNVQSSGEASDSTAVTATSVSLSTAVKGECIGRMGGARGPGGPSGMPSGAPSGAPDGAASGAPDGAASGAPDGAASGAPQSGQTPGGGRFRPVSGKVASVSGSSFTVTSTAFGNSKSQTYTVTTSGTTTVTQEKTATSAAIKTGTCATASGKADSTGAVTATTIALRPAVDGKCTIGFGRPSGQR